ncbi:hypothetical protein BRD02_10090 [Halobacteriales archaeon QS_8_69_73]|nr:MAG: hypothetical protein BRD02_10090 [Halobacteriales archaeon QS_8_69_73]
MFEHPRGVPRRQRPRGHRRPAAAVATRDRPTVRHPVGHDVVHAGLIRRRRDDGGGPFLVSHVGSIGARESLSAAADELIRLEGITAVVVTGEENGELHASGRSQDDRVHMGKTLEVAFDDLPDASFGGHSRMGGGRVSLPGGGRTNPPELATDGGSTELHAQLFAAMNGEL